MKKINILGLLSILILTSCSNGYKAMDDSFLETLNFTRHEEISRKTGNTMKSSYVTFYEYDYTIISPANWTNSLEFKNAKGVLKYETFEKNSNNEIVSIEKTVNFDFNRNGSFIVEFTCYTISNLPCDYEFISVSGSYKWEE